MKPWTSTFEDAEARLLDIGLSASPEQRLEWLEEAQRFALECAVAPPTPDAETEEQGTSSDAERSSGERERD